MSSDNICKAHTSQSWIIESGSTMLWYSDASATPVLLQEYIATFQNLQTVGRNGMHRYNNQDHSMLTALLAAKNTLGEHHDLWTVNLERSYHENFTDLEWAQIKQPTATQMPLSPLASTAQALSQ